jgi:hypothetical protein
MNRLKYRLLENYHSALIISGFMSADIDVQNFPLSKTSSSSKSNTTSLALPFLRLEKIQVVPASRPPRFGDYRNISFNSANKSISMARMSICCALIGATIFYYR